MRSNDWIETNGATTLKYHAVQSSRCRLYVVVVVVVGAVVVLIGAVVVVVVVVVVLVKFIFILYSILELFLYGK